MLEMSRKEIMPAVAAYEEALSRAALDKCRLDANLSNSMEKKLLVQISAISGDLYEKVDALEDALMSAKEVGETLAEAKAFRAEVIPAMNELRAAADRLETLVGEKYWPFPTYGDLVFSV